MQRMTVAELMGGFDALKKSPEWRQAFDAIFDKEALAKIFKEHREINTEGK